MVDKHEENEQEKSEEKEKKIDLTPNWALVNDVAEKVEDIFSHAKLGPLDYRIVITRLELMIRDYEMRLFIEHMAKQMTEEHHEPIEFKGNMFQ